MMKNTLRRGILLAVATVALGAGACAGPEVPAQPTWERDIYPLMIARCIRCHDTPGHQDPLVTQPAVKKIAAISFDSPRIEDNIVARAYLVARAVSAVKGVPADPSMANLIGRMPPPPAEALEDWQIEMLEKWTKDPR